MRITQTEKLRAEVKGSLGQKLLRLARLFNERAIREVQKKGHPLREAHTRLFPHLDIDGTRLTDLAARAKITKQSAQQLVDELVGVGYLERCPDPEDGRAKLIVMTRKGRRGLTIGLAALGAVEAELTKSVGRKEMLGLQKTVDTMLKALEE